MGDEKAVSLKKNLNVVVNTGDWVSPELIRRIAVGGATIVDNRLALSHKAKCMKRVKNWAERRKGMNHNLTIKTLANGRFTKQEIKLLQTQMSNDEIHEAENSTAMEERGVRSDGAAWMTRKLMSINRLLKTTGAREVCAEILKSINNGHIEFVEDMRMHETNREDMEVTGFLHLVKNMLEQCNVAWRPRHQYFTVNRIVERVTEEYIAFDMHGAYAIKTIRAPRSQGEWCVTF